VIHLGGHVQPWVTVGAGAVTFALCLMFLTGGYAGLLKQRTGRTVPEGGRQRYDETAILAYVRAAGESGWHVYRMQLSLDIVFAILLGVASMMLMNGVLGVRVGPHSSLRFLSLLPALAALADVGEDAALLYAMGPPPKPGVPPALAHAEFVSTAWKFTLGKFLLHVSWIVVTLIATQRLIELGPA
jgi:hypothetical protein